MLQTRVKRNTLNACIARYKAIAGERGYQTLINDTLRRAVEAEYFVQAMRNAIREELVEYAVEKGEESRSRNFSTRFAARTQSTMIRFFSVALLMLAFVIGGRAGAHVALKISLAHNSVTERETRNQLDRLLHKYDLSKWIYTEEIVIDDDAIPHSDPVLRYAG